jgi:leucyl aminopeptidase
LTYHGIKFVDTTGHASNDAAINPSSSSTFPDKIKYGKKALQKRFYEHIDTGKMKAFLEKFSGFRTRYYRSSTGRESQLWLLGKVTELVEQNPHLNMTVREFKHSWGQNSIIARLPVAHHVESRGKVIIGAHQVRANQHGPLVPLLTSHGSRS